MMKPSILISISFVIDQHVPARSSLGGHVPSFLHVPWKGSEASVNGCLMGLLVFLANCVTCSHNRSRRVELRIKTWRLSWRSSNDLMNPWEIASSGSLSLGSRRKTAPPTWLLWCWWMTSNTMGFDNPSQKRTRVLSTSWHIWQVRHYVGLQLFRNSCQANSKTRF